MWAVHLFGFINNWIYFKLVFKEFVIRIKLSYFLINSGKLVRCKILSSFCSEEKTNLAVHLPLNRVGSDCRFSYVNGALSFLERSFLFDMDSYI